MPCSRWLCIPALLLFLLAMAGARVIKVERPGSGDWSRSWGPYVDDVTPTEGQPTVFTVVLRNLGRAEKRRVEKKCRFRWSAYD